MSSANPRRISVTLPERFWDGAGVAIFFCGAFWGALGLIITWSD
jgi:hypothetical protein